MNHATPAPAASPAPAAPRRADHGRVRLTSRDVLGLILVAEHYGAPYDLLARSLHVTQPRVRALAARWRNAGLAETGTLGPGPAWCWATPKGMRAVGYTWPADPPALGQLAHHRAVLAVRLRMEADPQWRACHARWRCERKLRAGRPRAAPGHVPDAEITWPPASRSPDGELWAVEAELTPKGLPRTRAIMSGLLSQPYAAILYACGPDAIAGVTRAAAALPAAQAARVLIRKLPPAGLIPRPGQPCG